MRVNFSERKVSKGATHVKLAMKKSSIVNIKNEDSLCGAKSFVVQLHTPRCNPIRNDTYTKNLREIKTDGIYLPDGLKIDDIEKQNLTT